MALRFVSQVRSVVGHYIEGLHWVMDYYYRGVPSWTWYFPFHYAPFLSDLVDLDGIHPEIEMADPVRPFQQARARGEHALMSFDRRGFLMRDVPIRSPVRVVALVCLRATCHQHPSSPTAAHRRSAAADGPAAGVCQACAGGAARTHAR